MKRRPFARPTIETLLDLAFLIFLERHRCGAAVGALIQAPALGARGGVGRDKALDTKTRRGDLVDRPIGTLDARNRLKPHADQIAPGMGQFERFAKNNLFAPGEDRKSVV